MEKQEMNLIEVKEIVENKESNAVAINTRDAVLIENNMKAINQIAKTIKQSLIDGVDYGQIPGTGKPSLFKSGAEKIAQLFGLFSSYDILEKDIDKENGIIKYQFKCYLTTANGLKVAEGFGVCSSEEKKYNKQNPFDIENTIMKMAKKRALVDASISIGVLSEVFTQDLEDLPLSTKSNGGAQLGKFEILNLYTLLYGIFADFEEKFKDKETFKSAVKGFIPKILEFANIEKASLQLFGSKDKQQLLDYVNKKENMEVLKREFTTKFNKKNN